MHAPTNYLPAPKLREYIAGYGILEILEGVNEPFFSPPLGLSGFIIHSINSTNTVITNIQDRPFFTKTAVATGQVTHPVYGQMVGHVKSIMVFFHPLGMHRLFGNNMFLLTNNSQPLEDFLGEEKATSLLFQLKSNQNSENQVQVLDHFFGQITPVKNNVDKLIRVLNYIHDNKGQVSITDIDTYGNYTRKTLERQFHTMVGLSPKVYAQIYQFKCLINLLQLRPNITWAQLANLAGYYDQSHMSRYFKEYLKVSPNSIVKLDMEFINYLLNR